MVRSKASERFSPNRVAIEFIQFIKFSFDEPPNRLGRFASRYTWRNSKIRPVATICAIGWIFGASEFWPDHSVCTTKCSLYVGNQSGRPEYSMETIHRIVSTQPAKKKDFFNQNDALWKITPKFKA